MSRIHLLHMKYGSLLQSLITTSISITDVSSALRMLQTPVTIGNSYLLRNQLGPYLTYGDVSGHFKGNIFIEDNKWNQMWD